MKARSALLLTLLCALIVTSWQALRATLLRGMGDGMALLADMLVTLLAFGLPAAIGLLVIDGDQRQLVLLAVLSPAQVYPLAMAGVLAVAPATLSHDMLGVLLAWSDPAAAQMAAGRDAALFLPVMLRSTLLVPLCEELFFRGYLLGVLAPYGRKAAVISTALLFALMHSAQGMLPCLLLGLLLAVLTLRTDSLLAAVLVHASYNLTIMIISFSGLTPLFDRLSLPSCVLRLAMSACFVSMLLRAWRARPQRRRACLTGGGWPNAREIALCACALLCLLAAVAFCLSLPEVKG